MNAQITSIPIRSPRCVLILGCSISLIFPIVWCQLFSPNLLRSHRLAGCMTEMSTLILTLTTALYIHTISASFYNDVGVMIPPKPELASEIQNRARLMESDSCASASYTSGCSSSDPAGCPCSSFTDDERRQILEAHNFRREQSAAGNELCATSDGLSTEPCPAATKMNSLIWDEGLETIATYWAHQFGTKWYSDYTHNL